MPRVEGVRGVHSAPGAHVIGTKHAMSPRVVRHCARLPQLGGRHRVLACVSARSKRVNMHSCSRSATPTHTAPPCSPSVSVQIQLLQMATSTSAALMQNIKTWHMGTPLL